MGRTEDGGQKSRQLKIRNPNLEIRNKSEKPKKRKWENETPRLPLARPISRLPLDSPILLLPLVPCAAASVPYTAASVPCAAASEVGSRRSEVGGQWPPGFRFLLFSRFNSNLFRISIFGFRVSRAAFSVGAATQRSGARGQEPRLYESPEEHGR